MADQNLIVRVIGDSRSYEQALKRSQIAGKKFEQSFVGSMRSSVMAYKGLAVAVGAGIAVKGLKSTIDAASALNESVNAVQVTFKDASGVVERFSKVAATQAGLSMRQLNELVTPLGASLQNYGFSARQAAAESVKLARRAADMASVFNTDVSQALEAIQSALRGEADPIERFGVGLNEAAVNAEALRLGLARTTGQVTAQDKTVARLSLIYQQTAKFAGDFQRTSAGAANQQRIVAARVENLQASLGQKLLPVYADVLQLTNDLIDSVGKLGDAFDKLGGNRIKDFLDDTFGRAPTWVKAFGPTGPLGLLFRPDPQPVLTFGNAWKSVGAAISQAARNLDPFRQAFADIESAFGIAADKFGPKKSQGPAKPFVLPGPLRLAAARAQVTAAITDDVNVARQVRAYVNDLIRSGKLKGQRLIDALGVLADAQATIAAAQTDAADKQKAAAKKHADAVKAAAEKQKQAAAEAANKLREATDQARSEIGTLFQGPIAAPTELQRRQALGFAPPGAAGIAADIRAQTQQALRFEADLRRLRRAGVGQATITELRGLGTQVLPQVEQILGTRGGARRDIINALLGRERAARKIGQMIVQSPVVHVNANRVTVSGQGRRKSPARSGRFAGE